MIDWTKPLRTKGSGMRATLLGALPPGKEGVYGSVAVALHWEEGIEIHTYTRDGRFAPKTGSGSLDLVNADEQAGTREALIASTAVNALANLKAGKTDAARRDIEAIVKATNGARMTEEAA